MPPIPDPQRVPLGVSSSGFWRVRTPRPISQAPVGSRRSRDPEVGRCKSYAPLSLRQAPRRRACGGLPGTRRGGLVSTSKLGTNTLQ
jgi:hypothetical protein